MSKKLFYDRVEKIEFTYLPDLDGGDESVYEVNIKYAGDDALYGYNVNPHDLNRMIPELRTWRKDRMAFTEREI